jgi:hypothetical protein
LYQNAFLKKIKGTNHLTIKKKWGIKIYFTNKFENATYVIHVFHLSPISFNSTLPKKNMKLDANFNSKGHNCAKQKFKNQIFLTKSLLQFVMICERVNNDFMYIENAASFSFC